MLIVLIGVLMMAAAFALHSVLPDDDRIIPLLRILALGGSAVVSLGLIAKLVVYLTH